MFQVTINTYRNNENSLPFVDTLEIFIQIVFSTTRLNFFEDFQALVASEIFIAHRNFLYRREFIDPGTSSIWKYR